MEFARVICMTMANFAFRTLTIIVSGALVACGGVANNAGDGGAPSLDCSSLPKPPSLQACAAPVAGGDASTTAPLSLMLSGNVTAVNQGPISGGCLAASAVGDDSQIVALTVRATADGGVDDYDVEYAVPNNGVNWSVGDLVFLQYSRDGGGWSPLKVAFTLSHGQMGDVYVGHGGAVSDFSVVPFTFVQGQARCTTSETCGTWSAYDLQIVGSNGNTNVPYGATVNVNGYRVIHGGVREQLSATTTCADWFVADASVAVLRDAPTY
jgi:hypothetical protein